MFHPLRNVYIPVYIGGNMKRRNTSVTGSIETTLWSQDEECDVGAELLRVLWRIAAALERIAPEEE